MSIFTTNRNNPQGILERRGWIDPSGPARFLSTSLLILCAIFSPVTSPAADRRAEKAPAEEERSIEALASYLTADREDDREKARAIYVWITHNITYDAGSLEGGRQRTADPEELLRSRRSVCSGYASLFELLAKEAGLEAVTIRGYSKGYDYTVGQTVTGTNHAWNGVKIDGSWGLVDCTWGSGSLTEAMVFERKFDPFYFLPPPGFLILTHFPEDASWQLLDPAVSRDTFASTFHPKSLYFSHGLKTGEERGTLSASGPISLSIDTEADVSLMASLFRSGKALPEGHTFVNRREGGFTVFASPPLPGSYTLRIFLKPRTEEGEYEWALGYRIDLGEGPATALYPRTFEAFNLRRAELISPLATPLPGSGPLALTIRVPGAVDVITVSGEKKTHLTRRGDIFSGRPQPGGDGWKVFARFTAGSQYEGLLEYTLEAGP